MSLAFAALLAWYFSQPIRSLREAFRAVAAGNLSTRIGQNLRRRKDDLAHLGTDFDDMASDLQNMVEAQRRLLHDVSHELRSPLARLQAVVDLIRQQPNRFNELGERFERDIAQMDNLVDELLTLARIDGRDGGKANELVDIGELIAEIAEDARFEGRSKQCDVKVEIIGHIVLYGRRDLLQRAIENVVRNAVQHVPQSGLVEIVARSAAGRTLIEVKDNGGGVAESELRQIFEPFFRSGHGQPGVGYGLGLAITRQAVAAQGGRVWAANRPQGGLNVTMELPSLTS